MIDQAVHPAGVQGVEGVLRADLAHGDAVAASALPVLRYLVAAEDSALFSEEILARVRGMLADIAGQLLDALVGADRRAHSADEIEVLTRAFVGDATLLGHVHAQALEWQLTERMQARLALDPVMTPLVQARLPGTTAMAFLASQSRWCQAQRRMALPLSELPPSVLDAVMVTLRALVGAEPALADRVDAVETQVREGYDESATRLGLAASFVAEVGGEAQAALAIGAGGVALFLSALAQLSGQSRDNAVLSTHEGQLARLALGLKAAGLSTDGVEAQFHALHPEVTLPQGFAGLDRAQAAAMLASGGR